MIIINNKDNSNEKRENKDRKREIKFKGKKPVIHKIPHHPLTDPQLVPEHWLMTPGQIPQSDLFGMMIGYDGI